MFKVTIISVGSLKERHWRQAADEYIKRLDPYAKVKLVEVDQEPIKKVTDRQKILELEGERIKKHIPDGSIILALDRAGAQMTSPEWAEKLEQWSKFGSEIAFIIGGPLGLLPELLRRANQLVSFSKMTFTHEMVRVILLEQLYRAGTIQQGKQYHY